MEMSQGNSMCSYLKQAKIFFFLFYSTKSENRRAVGGGVVGCGTTERVSPFTSGGERE
jgi:hypothetical protein